MGVWKGGVEGLGVIPWFFFSVFGCRQAELGPGIGNPFTSGNGLWGGGGASEFRAWLQGFGVTIRALMVTYTILEVPYYKYSIMGPKMIF